MCLNCSLISGNMCWGCLLYGVCWDGETDDERHDLEFARSMYLWQVRRLAEGLDPWLEWDLRDSVSQQRDIPFPVVCIAAQYMQ